MRVALFLTSGTSLRLWAERGWLAGGVGIASYNQWADACQEVLFLTYGGEEDTQYGQYLRKNIRVLPRRVRLPAFLYGFLMPFLYRRELQKVDIVYSAQMEGSWAALIAKKLFKKKFILRCGYQWGIADFGSGLSASLRRAVARRLEHWSYRNADRILLTSERARQRVQKDFGIPSEHIDVLHNPVDTTVFRPLQLEKAPRSIIFVGRLEKEKNLPALFRALCGLKASLSVVGAGSLEQELRQQAEADQLDVRFLGNVPNNTLPELLNRHEVFVLPSLYENSPKALLEAMGCGMAVVATDVMGNNEVLQHKVSGYLCGTDADSLHAALREVLDHPHLRASMQEHAHREITEHYTLEKKVAADLQLFRSLAAPHTS